MSQTVKLLHDLIALPSINTAFLSKNNPLAGEERITDYIIGRAN